jgi:hypothetical protein
MQFVMMIYQGTTPLPNTEEWSKLSSQEQKAVYADYAAINKTTGVTPGLPLGQPADAKTVRVDDGKTVTSEGPYLGTDGAVGGYLVFEADDLATAIDVASRIPAARLGGAIEVRPVATYW